MFLYNVGPHPDIGFIVSRKKGIAVARNKFKRRCRSVFRETDIFQRKNLNIIIKPTGTLVGWKNIKIAFAMLSSKIYE